MISRKTLDAWYRQYKYLETRIEWRVVHGCEIPAGSILWDEMPNNTAKYPDDSDSKAP